MEPNSSTTLLQLLFPEIHQRMVQAFEQIGLHSYDVKAEILNSGSHADEGNPDITIRVRFGETFSEYEDLTINSALVTVENAEILSFFQTCAQRAHETLKEEYKESMNIGRPRREKRENGG